MGHTLNDKQLAVCDGFDRRESMVVQAPGGTGKTALVAEFAKRNPGMKIYYFAFNKEIVSSAKAKMPKNVTCYTIHAYAMGRKGRFYQKRLPKTDGTYFRMSNKDTAAFLAITDIDLPDRTISASKCASLVMRGISNFSKSSSWQISGWHIPHISGLMPEEMKIVRDSLDTAIKTAWEDIKNPHGKLNFSHENYVKLWAMDPACSTIAADAVVIDEAQDVSSAVITVLQRRARKGKQLVILGDEYQAINEWAGAENSMGQFPDFKKYTLDITYRFDQDIADLANDWLKAMGADMRLIGVGPKSAIGPVELPEAILCRTNAQTIAAAIDELAAGRKVHLLGNVEEFTAIAEAALDLEAGRTTDHYLFTAYGTWPEVQIFAKSGDPDADEIKTWVTLIDAYGAQEIKDMIAALVSKELADVIIATAHKTKGKEYRSVRVVGFLSNEERTRPMTMADMMLAYVTITRAMEELDPENLARPPEFDGETGDDGQGDDEADDGEASEDSE